MSFLERAGFLAGIRTAYSLKTFFKATRMAQELAMSVGEGPSLIPLATPPQNEIGHADGLTTICGWADALSGYSEDGLKCGVDRLH